MDLRKYRHWYLADPRYTCFKKIEYNVDEIDCLDIENVNISIYFQKNHPKVLSGEGYWLTHRKLCIGYELIINKDIYRPIFQYERQNLLDKVNKNIYNPINFWNKVKSKYFLTLSEKKKIPIECIKYIINYIY